MHTLKNVFLAVVLTGLVLGSARAATPIEEAYQLYRSSGLRTHYTDAFASAGSMWSGGERSQQSRAREYTEQFDSVALQSIAQLPYQERAYLTQWFESPLGSKVAHLNANQIDVASNNHESVDRGLLSGVSEHRQALISAFVDESELVDTHMRLGSSVVQSLALTAEGYGDFLQDSPDKASKESEAQLNNTRDALRQALIERYVVLYREFDRDEVLQITQAMSSDAYRRFESGLYEAVGDVLAVVFYDYAQIK